MPGWGPLCHTIRHSQEDTVTEGARLTMLHRTQEREVERDREAVWTAAVDEMRGMDQDSLVSEGTLRHLLAAIEQRLKRGNATAAAIMHTAALREMQLDMKNQGRSAWGPLVNALAACLKDSGHHWSIRPMDDGAPACGGGEWLEQTLGHQEDEPEDEQESLVSLPF